MKGGCLCEKMAGGVRFGLRSLFGCRIRFYESDYVYEEKDG